MLISIKVKPNARTSALTKLEDGSYAAHIKALPVEGKANLELIALVAAYFGCRKAQVSIKSGGAGRTKLIQIAE